MFRNIRLLRWAVGKSCTTAKPTTTIGASSQWNAGIIAQPCSGIATCAIKPVSAIPGVSINQHSAIFSIASRKIHTKGERELVEFLAEEIVAEKKASPSATIPTSLNGFAITANRAEVELTKSSEREKVTISFNVNHTVDMEGEEAETTENKPEFSAMKSRPQFEVDIMRGGTTLSFTCSYLPGEAQEGEYNDVFGIDEVTIFQGEWNDKVYAVAGDVLDGYLYDLLMNFLEEKGISNEFAEKMSDFASAYEHAKYVELLEAISKFTVEKK
ncbi:complement component 1 Q subcomponent-binding protein, mitochondrial [Anopheles marshallii]|uniref:complement component 1 Q subcomponent-binding protein, mitochondrial n=1 Tax=Anopheles marshallii TaxID=1521116 RepID=UPI00237ACDC2|nr:complement component 1 Q subcomponent-binding protein, mitochondrial [Anopheles marshallii]